MTALEDTQHKLTLAVEALKFYADDNNWSFDAVDVGQSSVGYVLTGKMEYDQGALAKKTIAAIEKGTK